VALICETEADAARAHDAAEVAARWDGVRAMDPCAQRARRAQDPAARGLRRRRPRPLVRPTAAASPRPTASRSSATVPSAPRWALRNTWTAS
jgi:hypothetical protein